MGPAESVYVSLAVDRGDVPGLGGSRGIVGEAVNTGSLSLRI